MVLAGGVVLVPGEDPIVQELLGALQLDLGLSVGHLGQVEAPLGLVHLQGRGIRDDLEQVIARLHRVPHLDVSDLHDAGDL